MLSYIAKRLLLMIPTLIGVLTVTFILIQFVPGGPVDQLVAEMRGATLTLCASRAKAAARLPTAGALA